jgi:hypothetical protein
MKYWEECTHKERIARWENALRVLEELTPHERKKHWDMGWFGEKTDCGTVACAAGHCGLDPWFRRRGFKMDFKWNTRYPGAGNWDLQFEANDVNSFFGDVGSQSVFWKGDRRPVTRVIQEIRMFLKTLKKDTEYMEGKPIPRRRSV